MSLIACFENIKAVILILSIACSRESTYIIKKILFGHYFYVLIFIDKHFIAEDRKMERKILVCFKEARFIGNKKFYHHH